ncbi:MAG TPA: formimidoylglutamate deiminase [Stellaceae bacterium]|nr:formimidoylglutamate deiminase [Stellaceae bacterium]
MTVLRAEAALLPDGWAENVRITLGPAGVIASIERGADAASAERLAGPVLPGMPNLHSHAFQRAMAGLTERASPAGDDFWSWRETMYRFLAVLEPEDVRAIAAQLYVEMAKAGFTTVGEFHYLHNGRDGQPYADRAIMCEALIEAADEAGVGLTLLPVLYEASGFGGISPTAAQRRFLGTPETILEMIAGLKTRHRNSETLRIGLAPHSLRAVTAGSLEKAVAGLHRLDPSAPLHLHIAEQTGEVEQCLAWSGQRPVAWLLDHAEVDRRWCLVHATHIDAAETARLATTGATVGLCPTTEANLGDGLFPFAEFTHAGGVWGIGSDSQVSINPIEELRWLEYGQRLFARRRALAATEAISSTGAALWRAALAGGRQALAQPIGRLAPGERADILVLDAASPALYGRKRDDLLDSLVFAGGPSAISDVMIAGRWVVRGRLHRSEAPILKRFRETVDRLPI